MKFKITETEKRALCRQVPEFREFVRQITLPELECDGDLFGEEIPVSSFRSDNWPETKDIK